MTAWADVADMPTTPESTSSQGLVVDNYDNMVDYYIDANRLPHFFYYSSTSSSVCAENYLVVEVYKPDPYTWAKRCANLQYDYGYYARYSIMVTYDEVNDVAWLAARQRHSSTARIVIYKRDDGQGETGWTYKKYYNAPSNDIDYFAGFDVDGSLNGGTLALSYLSSISGFRVLIVSDINDDTFTLKYHNTINSKQYKLASTMGPNGNIHIIYGDQQYMRYREWVWSGADGAWGDEANLGDDFYSGKYPAVISHPTTSEPFVIYWSGNYIYGRARVSGTWQGAGMIRNMGSIGYRGEIAASYLQNGDISLHFAYWTSSSKSNYMQRNSGTWNSGATYSAKLGGHGGGRRLRVITREHGGNEYTYVGGTPGIAPTYPQFMTDEPVNSLPSVTINSVTQKGDKSAVDISVEVDDADDDDVWLKVEYKIGADCSSGTSQATLDESAGAVADFDDSGGAPSVENDDEYQVGFQDNLKIITSSGSNTVEFDWQSWIDEPTTEDTFCIKVTPLDNDTWTGTPATDTVSILLPACTDPDSDGYGNPGTNLYHCSGSSTIADNCPGYTNADQADSDGLPQGDFVGYWKLDEESGSAADEAINSFDGTLKNFPGDDSEWVAGKVGNGLQFGGTDDYVEVAHNSSFNLTDAITLAAWVKTSSEGYVVVKDPYVWQPVETGTLAGPQAYNYIMGYEFTPQMDGTVTELCAFFNGGYTKTVKLWDAARNELAETTVTSDDTWECSSITPVNVTGGNSYYVGVCLVGTGARYRTGLGGLYPFSSNDVSIDNSIYYSTTGCTMAAAPTINTTNMYGLADINISFVKSDVPFSLSTVGGGQFLIRVSDVDYTVTSTTNVNDGGWHHIAATYDYNEATPTMRFYVDGQPAGTSTSFSGQMPTNDDPVWIGRHFDPTETTGYFNGVIDEVAVLNKALSGSEIEQIYNNSVGGNGYSGDGVGDVCDNCRIVYNEDQNDVDGNCTNYTLPYASDPVCGDACQTTRTLAPEDIYSNDSSVGAQSGEDDPTDLSDLTPEFSAVMRDDEPTETVNKFCIVVDTTTDFDGTRMWTSDNDSCNTGTSMPSVAVDGRMIDIEYDDADNDSSADGIASTLQYNTLYYWGIKFWSSSGTPGYLSNPETFRVYQGTGSLTSYGVQTSDVIIASDDDDIDMGHFRISADNDVYGDGGFIIDSITLDLTLGGLAAYSDIANVEIWSDPNGDGNPSDGTDLVSGDAVTFSGSSTLFDIADQVVANGSTFNFVVIFDFGAGAQAAYTYEVNPTDINLTTFNGAVPLEDINNASMPTITINTAPTADAGTYANINEEDDQVFNNATADDPDSSQTLTYSWSLSDNAGGKCALSNDTQLNATLHTSQALTNYTCTAELIVDDGMDTSGIVDTTITILADDDPPTASAQSPSTNEDVDLGITLTGSDPEEGSLTFYITSLPSNGNLLDGVTQITDVSGDGHALVGALTYDPNLNYNGGDSFQFKAYDGTNFSSAAAAVSITVNAQNDTPTVPFSPTVDNGASSDNRAQTGVTVTFSVIESIIKPPSP